MRKVTILAFLEHLEHDRGNSPRTRNARLAALRSMFAYAALRHPEHAELIARVIAIPQKRHDKPLVAFLTKVEIKALLAAPDRSTWIGRRDHALLATAIQTGLRVSELTGLNCGDVTLGVGGCVQCLGKGRKARQTPLTNSTQKLLSSWLRERASHPNDPLFPTSTGARLTRDAIARRITKHAATAARRCPSNSGQAAHAPHPAAHQRDATAARRRRYDPDRAVARARGRPLHPDLHPRRHDDQGTHARADHPAVYHARTLQAPRPSARVPGEPMSP